jgi:hypothetical protein
VGYDILLAVLCIAIVPLVLAGFVGYWIVTAHDRGALETAFAHYARSRRLELIPARGEWPNRSSPEVRWLDDGARYRLWVRGSEGKRTTSIEIQPAQAVLGRALISLASSAHWQVEEQPVGLAERVMGDTIRNALSAFRQGDAVRIELRRGRATLSWPGGECNETRLDEARALAFALSERLNAAFRSGA